MAPDQNGTVMNFSSDDVRVASLSFTKNSGWPTSNCELVVFLQNNSSKEILQGFKIPLGNLQPMQATDGELVEVYNVPGNSCSGQASPLLKIKNKSNAPLYTATIRYKINNGALYSHSWSGNLGLNQENIFQIPQMTFSSLPENTFTAYIQNTNATNDLNPANDTIMKAFYSAGSHYSTINIEILTDNKPHETTWQVLNSANQVIFSGGPYTGQPNTLVQEQLLFQNAACLKFIINDAGGDGLCCSSGNGYFTIKDFYQQPLHTASEFGPKETFEFGIYATTLTAIAYLEAPFDDWTFEMNTNLNQQGLLPLSQPYSIPPWNYYGTESVVAIPGADIVDWVLVELRETNGGPETATSMTTVSQQAAFLNNMGDLIGFDGSSTLRFDAKINNNLFIVLHHRNHVSFMNAQPANGILGNYFFDFTASVNSIYGGASGCTTIQGMALMAAGDGNSDGAINILDIINSWGTDAGKQGYYSGDFNFDGQVENRDKNGLFLLNFGKQSQVPE